MRKIQQYVMCKNNGLSFLITLAVKFRKNMPQNLKALHGSYTIFRALRKKGKLLNYDVTLTGCIIFYTHNIVLKFPITNAAKEDIIQSQKAYMDLKKRGFDDFIPYQRRENKGMLFMSKLQKAASDTYTLSDITDRFLAYSAPDTQNDATELFDALTLKIKGLERIKHVLEHYKYQSGFMHGDLTPANIMRDKNGSIALIDWDKFNPDGALLYDRLHYEVEKDAKATSRYNRYYTTLINKINMAENQQDIQDLTFYFLYRLSIEYKNIAAINRADQKALNNIIDIIALKYKAA